MKGLDEDWSKVNPAQAYAAGFRFVIGYVSQDTTGKNLTASDVKAIHIAGMAVGFVYEYNPQSALGGYAQGVIDGNIALAGLKNLSVPTGVACYTAIDFNASPGQMAACYAYAQGFASVMLGGGYRHGVYCGYPVALYLRSRGYDGFIWQTYAWSNGAWLNDAALRQVQNGVTVAGATIDVDVSEVNDFGQWELSMREVDMVLLNINMSDGTVRSGPTDCLGHFHWVPDTAAWNELQTATGLAARTVTQDMALRAYGIDFSAPVTPNSADVLVSGSLVLTPKV